MTEKRILFGDFVFSKIRGLEYLLDEEKPRTDYLFVNDPRERFSMYFEKDFPVFFVPDSQDRSYCLFEIKRPQRRIRFFCPEKRTHLREVVWYFYVEMLDGGGKAHGLPGQVRVNFQDDFFTYVRGRPKFLDVLEQIELNDKTDTA